MQGQHLVVSSSAYAAYDRGAGEHGRFRGTRARLNLTRAAAPRCAETLLGHSVTMLYETYAGLFDRRSQREKGLAAITEARRPR